MTDQEDNNNAEEINKNLKELAKQNQNNLTEISDFKPSNEEQLEELTPMEEEIEGEIEDESEKPATQIIRKDETQKVKNYDENLKTIQYTGGKMTNIKKILITGLAGIAITAGAVAAIHYRDEIRSYLGIKQTQETPKTDLLTAIKTTNEAPETPKTETKPTTPEVKPAETTEKPATPEVKPTDKPVEPEVKPTEEKPADVIPTEPKTTKLAYSIKIDCENTQVYQLLDKYFEANEKYRTLEGRNNKQGDIYSRAVIAERIAGDDKKIQQSELERTITNFNKEVKETENKKKTDYSAIYTNNKKPEQKTNIETSIEVEMPTECAQELEKAFQETKINESYKIWVLYKNSTHGQMSTEQVKKAIEMAKQIYEVEK